ncbi:MAG: ribonucleotide-diphosphate reductase subunit beta [Gemmatimonadaceae bacterium]|nr:ribonucleotide-diphosphate reductase subunit beta [Gemmatimonadaceae bacterium]
MPMSRDQTQSKYFQLYTNSKRLAWDPAAIDLSRDAADWALMRRDFATEDYARQMHQLCAFFHAGEESVTSTLAPLLGAVARLKLGVDIECYLTSQIYEEAKHFEFFTRYFHEVLGEETASLLGELTPAPQAVLIDELDATTDRVRSETDTVKLRAALVEAVTHYMGVVEAMLARTGYVGASDALAARNWLPGLQEGFRLIRRDEGRHVSFGIHFLRDMTRLHPELIPVVQQTFERHLPNVLATVQAFYYPHPIVDLDKLTQYALDAYEQFMGAIGLSDVEDAPLTSELEQGTPA